MPNSISTTLSATIDGTEYKQTTTIASDTELVTNPTVAAAKTGTLTTRTDNDTSTLTMTTGHGFVTNDKVDVFWTGGSRRGMTATVTGDSVVVDGGSGDNLPVATTTITAMKPTNVPFSVVGDNVDSLAVSTGSTSVQGWVVFKTSAPAVIASYQIASGAKSKVWVSGLGITNPLAGQTVASIDFSHGSTAAQDLTAAVTY